MLNAAWTSLRAFLSQYDRLHHNGVGNAVRVRYVQELICLKLRVDVDDYRA